MPLDLKSDRPDADKAPGRVRIELSRAGLAGAVGLLLVGLAWVFIIGVLVGRGYKPEQAVPELARMMPQAPNATAEAPAAGVLKAEELGFYDDLEKKPLAPAAGAKAAPGPAPRPEAEAAPKPAEPAPKAAEPAPKAEAAPQAAPQAALDEASDTNVYDYRYQVAALGDQASAKAFQARLAALGIASSLESAEVGGRTWLRVLAHHQGTPESTRELKDKLRTLGVDKPIMRSKTLTR